MPRPKGSKNKVKATKVTADFAAQIAAKQEEKAAVEAQILKVAASIEELKTDVKPPRKPPRHPRRPKPRMC